MSIGLCEDANKCCLVLPRQRKRVRNPVVLLSSLFALQPAPLSFQLARTSRPVTKCHHQQVFLEKTPVVPSPLCQLHFSTGFTELPGTVSRPVTLDYSSSALITALLTLTFAALKKNLTHFVLISGILTSGLNGYMFAASI